MTAGATRIYCVRAQTAVMSRGAHRFQTVKTVAVEARTYSQARWWGTKMLRWQGVTYSRISLRREPSGKAMQA